MVPPPPPPPPAPPPLSVFLQVTISPHVSAVMKIEEEVWQQYYTHTSCTLLTPQLFSVGSLQICFWRICTISCLVSPSSTLWTVARDIDSTGVCVRVCV